MARKFSNKKRYIAAFLIGTGLFILVFIASYYISYGELYKASAFQDDSAYSFLENRLDYEFFNESTCNEENFKELNEDLAFSGQRIGALEERLGKNHKAVLERKKLYSILQLEHFMFLKTYRKNCDGLEPNSILFFYSNEEENGIVETQTESELAGRVLSKINQKREGLFVYSFDANLNTTLIEKLKARYEISSKDAPIAVVNEKRKIRRFEREEIEMALNNTSM